MNPVEVALDELAGLRELQESERQRKEDAVEAAIPEEVREKIERIKQEFDHHIASVGKQISEKETLIRDKVVRNGVTINGQWLSAVFMKGRVSWDSKALDAYAVSDPKILAFRKEGSPSVTIRSRSTTG